MVQMHIVIMDYESNTVRAFNRAFEVGIDVEYELIQSGEFNPETGSIMFSSHDIHVDIEGLAHFIMHD